MRVSTEALLGRCPYADQEHKDALRLLTSFDAEQIRYVDVPLAAVMALGRWDFWKSGDSWRDIVSRQQPEDRPHDPGMHGRDWTDRVFPHFEGELRDDCFPAGGAAGPLKLRSYGGFIECESGNHRLVGAYCWLASKDGHLAKLRKARVSYRPIRRPIRERIAESLVMGREFAVLAPRSPGRLRIASIPVQSPSWWRRPPAFFSSYDPVANCCTPWTIDHPGASDVSGTKLFLRNDVVSALLSDAWLTSQPGEFL